MDNIPLKVHLVFLIHKGDDDILLNFIESLENLIFDIEDYVVANTEEEYIDYEEALIYLKDILDFYTPISEISNEENITKEAFNNSIYFEQKEQELLYNLFSSVIHPYVEESSNYIREIVENSEDGKTEFNEEEIDSLKRFEQELIKSYQNDTSNKYILSSYFTSLVDHSLSKKAVYPLSKLANTKEAYDSFYINIIDIRTKVPYSAIDMLSGLLTKFESELEGVFGYVLVPMQETIRIKEELAKAAKEEATKDLYYRSFTPLVLGAKEGQINYDKVADKEVYPHFKNIKKSAVPSGYIADQEYTEELLTYLIKLSLNGKDTTIKYTYDKLQEDMDNTDFTNREEYLSNMFNLYHRGFYDKHKVVEEMFNDDEINETSVHIANKSLIFTN